MSDDNIRSLDVVGDRLSEAFERSETVTRRRRVRNAGFGAIAAIGLVVLASVAFIQFDGDRVLTIDEAIAEVRQGSFELPNPGADQMLYTVEDSMWTAGAGTTTRSGRRLWFNQLITVRREQWTNPRRTGISRSSFIDAKYVSPQDEAMAELMQAENDRERRRIERAREKRGDRRPVPRYPVSIPPFTKMDSGGETKPDPLVCPVGPARGWINFEGDPLSAAEVKKLPTDPALMYNRVAKATREFRRNVDRDRWVWSTIHWALGSGANELSTAQRSAMVGAIAYVPGVRTLGETEDPLGRKTIGFFREGREQHDELYFDANTSLPIYAQSINTTKRGRGRAETWPVGSVFQKSIIRETKIVDRIPPTLKPKKYSRAPNGHYICVPSL